ncbi:MAG: starch-binding protein, partial [Erysipelotrichaceae bacterium]|nr:starch-binding protein [Erysipelotrichaceae bacterium]
MNKKLILSLGMVALGLVALASCKPVKHDHTYDGSYLHDSTQHWQLCTADGCDVEINRENHHGGIAKCGEKLVCVDCGVSYGSVQGHVFNVEKIETKYLASEADCENPATYYYVCSCGEKGSETFTVGDPLGHKFSDWATKTPADCDHAEVEARKCSVCGEEETRTGDPANHKYSEWTTKTPADCENAEVLERECSVCHDKETKPGKAALGHAWGGWTTKTPADCNNAEVEERECSTCHTKETRTGDAALGHELVIKFDANQHWQECSNGCGHSTTKENHKGGIATETELAKCSVCNQPYGDYADHTHAFTEQIKDEDHIKSAATCIDDAVYYYDCAEAGCNTIGTTYWVDTDSKLGHDMGEWSNVGLDGNKTQECERDGCDHKVTEFVLGSSSSPINVDRAVEAMAGYSVGDTSTATAYVSGTIVSIEKNYSGNGYYQVIISVPDSENQLVIYRPTSDYCISVGDDINASGYLQLYNETTYELIEGTIYAVRHLNTFDISHTIDNVLNVTVSAIPATSKCCETITFTAEPKSGYKVTVFVNDVKVNPTEGNTYEVLVQENISISIETEAIDTSSTTVSTMIKDYAEANSWTNETRYESVVMDSVVTVTANPTTGSYNNTGKYYTNGNNWRIYQNEAPELTVTVASGYELVSVVFTYASQNTGIITLGSEQYASGSVISVSGTSVTFSVGNTGTATNGQARISAIEVTYRQLEICEHQYTDSWTERTPASCTEDGEEYRVCTLCGQGEETRPIVATGHDYEGQEYKLATPDTLGHYQECKKCGEASEVEEHTEGTAATEDSKAVCEVCNKEYGQPLSHTHLFDQEVSEEAYVKVKETCDDDGEYYYSCECGEKGTETFKVDAIGHSYGEWSKVCLDGYKVRVCSNDSAHTEKSEYMFGSATAPKTIAESHALIDETGANSDSPATGAAYIVGYVKSMGSYNSEYNNYNDNIILVDDLSSNNAKEIALYRALNPENINESAVNVGDKLVVCGYYSKYNSSYQLSQKSQIISIEHVDYEVSCTVVDGEGNPSTNATVSTISSTVKSGSTVTFTVTPKDGYDVVVKLNGSKITATTGNEYSFVVEGKSVIEVVVTEEGSTPVGSTIKTVIGEYAAANGWTNSTQYGTVVMDDVVTVTAVGGSNTGKYYTSGNNWRIYQTETPEIKVSVASGYELVSVKITYTIDKTGVLTLNGANVASDEVVSASETAIVFSVGNTDSSVTNGQVRITAIEVEYKVSGSSTPDIPHTCTFDQQVATDVYKDKDATCLTKATYFYSCECGEKGSETFEYGEALGHDYTNAEWKFDAEGHYQECQRDNCGAPSTKAPHTYDEDVYVSNEDGHYQECNVCGRPTETEGHTGGVADATHRKECEICGEEYGNYVVTLYYLNTLEWNNVHIWAWTENGANHTGESWPGELMHSYSGEGTTNENWYYYSFEVETTEGLKFIFNGGGDDKTSNLDFSEGKYYYYGNGLNACASFAEAEEKSVVVVPQWFIKGTMNDWSAVTAYELALQEGTSIYQLNNVKLTLGSSFKIGNAEETAWIGYEKLDENSKQYVSQGDGGNINLIVNARFNVKFDTATSTITLEFVEKIPYDAKTYYFKGDINNWSGNDDYLLSFDEDTYTYSILLDITELPSEFKLTDTKDGWTGEITSSNIDSGCTNFGYGSNGNISITKTGTYKIELSVLTNKISYVYYEAHSHNYGDTYVKNETHHWQECSVCGMVSNKAEHSGTPATCLEASVCSCGHIIAKALKHDYELVEEEPATCTENGIKEHYVCKNGCGGLFVKEDNEYKLVVQGQLVIQAPGHIYGEMKYDDLVNGNIYQECTCGDKKVTFVFGKEDSPLTVADSHTIITAMVEAGSNNANVDSYVVGYVRDITYYSSSSSYTINIVDDLFDKDSAVLNLYYSLLADGIEAPAIGEIIVVRGKYGVYGSKYQLGQYNEITKVEAVSYSIDKEVEYEEGLEADVVVNVNNEAYAGDTVTFTLSGVFGYDVAVYLNDSVVALTPTDGVYSFVATHQNTIKVVVSKKAATPTDEKTQSIVIADYADENSWVDATQYLTISKGDITVVATGGGNTGKYYVNGEEWRIYQTESPTVTISVPKGYLLVSVKVTYASNKTGVLTLNGNVSSGAVTNASGTSITFGVGNTSTETKGQVRITAIDVVYLAPGEVEPPHTHVYDQENPIAKFLKSAADCENAAVYYRSCTCGEFVVDAENTFTYGDPLGHDYGSWTITIEPTLTSEGKAQQVCSRNPQHVNEIDIANLANTEVWTSEVTKQPECEAVGETTYTSIYGAVKVEIAATGHSYGAGVVTGPTCTEEGYTTYTCACGHSYIDNKVDELGHIGGTATCIKLAECTRCGEEYGVYADHTWGTEYTHDTEGHWTTCTVVGCNATSTKEAHETTYEYNETTHWEECGCGYKTIAEAHETGKEATFAAAATCECGKVLEEKLDTLYLVPGSWTSDGAWFAAHFFKDGGTLDPIWVKFIQEGTVYSVVVPEGEYDTVIFTRMDKNKEELDWSSKWNESCKVSYLDSEEDIYYIQNPWDESKTGFFISKVELYGSINNWESPISLTKNGYDYSVDLSINTGDNVSVKFVINGNWMEKGKFNYDCHETINVNTDGSNNIVITTTVGGTYTIRYNTKSNTVSISPLVIHEYVIKDAEVPATCLGTGTKATYKCNECGQTFIKEGEVYVLVTNDSQLIIPAKGHTPEVVTGKEATCTENGKKQTYKCPKCEQLFIKVEESYVLVEEDSQIVIFAKGHTEVIDAAKAPTCTETGLTEGKHCSACEQVLTVQQTVEKVDHNFENGEWEIDEYGHSQYCIYECGTVNNRVEHNYENQLWIVDEERSEYHNKTCECGYVLRELHDNSDSATSGIRTCSSCSATFGTNGMVVTPEETTNTYTFSDYEKGTQYASNEVHKLDEIVTITTTESHFTTELRIYSSSTHNGYAIIKSELPISTIKMNAGNNSDTINVYYSTDSISWTLFGGIAITSSYKDHSLDFGENSYKYLKLDVAGSNQVRIKSMTLTLIDSKETPCEHDWVNKPIFKSDATHHIQECPICHDTTKIAKHVGTSAVEGEKATCTVCSAKFDEFPHVHNYNIPEIVAPTCTEQGYTKYLCECGLENGVKDNFVSANGHSWNEGEVTKEATCTETGVRTYTCKNDAKHTYTEVIPVVDHTAGVATEENIVEATCTDAGSYDSVVYCSVCDAEISRTTVPVEAKGHDFTEQNTDSMYLESEATCTEKAKYYYSCSRCDEKGTETFEYGDVLVTNVTINNTPYNTLEAAVEAAEVGTTIELENSLDLVTAIEINKDLTINLKGNTLTVKNDTEGNGVFHVTSGATLTLEGEGTINGAGNNKWNIAVFVEGENSKAIINNGTFTNKDVDPSKWEDNTHFDLIYVKDGATVEINGGTFECITPKWTLNSHDTLVGTIVVNGGSFYDYDPSKSDTEPGEGTTNFLEEGLCTVLEGKYYVVAAHNYSSVVTDPTCTEKGYTTHTCSVCGDSYVDNYVDALKHDWDEGEITTYPSCTETGVRTYTCKNDANHTKTEPVDPTGHTNTTEKYVVIEETLYYATVCEC